MRRGVGVKGVARKKEQQAKLQEKGQELAEDQLKQLTAQMQTFKVNLEEFARKYKNDIKKNPEFRMYFQEMCAEIGVDPLTSSKGFWAEMLGVGNFYYELGVQVIEICMATRHANGGLMKLMDIRNKLNNQRRKKEYVSDDDLIRSIKKLKSLGSGFALLSLPSGYYVQSVPGEFNTDHTQLLALAETNSFITTSTAISELHWDEERVKRVLAFLVKEEFAWIDQIVGKETLYWFPSIFISQKNIDLQ